MTPAQKSDTQPIPAMCQWHANEIDTVKRVLYGNGQEGLLKTVNTLDITTTSMDEKLDGIIDAVADLTSRVSSMSISIAKHYDDPLLHSAKVLLFSNLGAVYKIIVIFVAAGISLMGLEGLLNFVKWIVSLL